MNAISEISDRDLRFYRRFHQNQIFDEIVGYFASLAEKGQLKKSDIAKRLKKHASQITNWLTEPGNMSIDTISDLLVAMDAEMEFSVRPARRNQQSVDALANSFRRWKDARVEGSELRALMQRGRLPPRETGGNNTLGGNIASTAD